MHEQARFSRRTFLKLTLITAGVSVIGCKTPAIPQSNQTGQLEEVNCDNARGWVKRDPKMQSAPAVRLYVDGQIFNGGTFSGVTNPEPENVQPKNLNSREFSIGIIEPLKNGKPHEVRAYAQINENALQAADFQELSGSPKTINCSPKK